MTIQKMIWDEILDMFINKEVDATPMAAQKHVDQWEAVSAKGVKAKNFGKNAIDKIKSPDNFPKEESDPLADLMTKKSESADNNVQVAA